MKKETRTTRAIKTLGWMLYGLIVGAIILILAWWLLLKEGLWESLFQQHVIVQVIWIVVSVIGIIIIVLLSLWIKISCELVWIGMFNKFADKWRQVEIKYEAIMDANGGLRDSGSERSKN